MIDKVICFVAISMLLGLASVCATDAQASTASTGLDLSDGAARSVDMPAASAFDSWLGDLLDNLGGSEELQLDDGIDWGVLPGPFVNPLQGFGVGVAAIGLYSPDGREESTQISTISVKSYVSTSGSYGLGVENRTYFGDDTWRLALDGWISRAPQDYWGVGREAAVDDSNKRAVQARVVEFSPHMSYRLLPSTYISLGWDFQSYRDITLEDSALIPQENMLISGISVGLAYDSRDFALNAYEGVLISLDYDAYLDELGSGSEFQRTTVNYRQYHRLDANLVLAWEVYGQGLSGDIPWFALSEVGKNGRMRGYYQGQYRDKYQLNTQVELRHQVSARHGFVYWLGAGNVAPDIDGLFNQAWLPTVGVGYRLTFKPRVNIRFDFGIGKDTSGFYFQINEAF